MEQRVLGGEGGRRGFFGTGTKGGKTRTVALIVVAIVGAFATLSLGLTGLVLMLVAAGIVFVLTIPTQHGSPLARIQRSRGWRERRRTGTDRFIPVDQRPANLTEPPAGREAQKEWNAYRDWPDGAEGMHWLQRGPREPGILWHAPTGEDAYLSVCFSVEGQVRGIESDTFLDHAQVAFGQLLARYGTLSALPNRVQSLTHVMPVDSAYFEQWVARELEFATDVVRPFVESYDEVLRLVSNSGFMQRHFMVIRWPLTADFIGTAARRGPAQDGWKQLMAAEIRAVTSHLTSARMGQVTVLSAARLAGVLRHMQNPSWPIDQVTDLDIDRPWIPSHDELSATVTVGPGPDGCEETWWHRTALIPISSVDTGPRSSLWLAPLLSQLPHPIVRTLSLQIEVVPAADARKAARTDVTTDLADLAGQQEKGVLTSEELTAGLSAARARLEDLRPGSGHHGVGWAGHLTISTRTRAELIDATAKITEAAGNAAISGLTWYDGQQAAAQACTWPIARGMQPVIKSNATILRGLLAGAGNKEAI